MKKSYILIPLLVVAILTTGIFSYPRAVFAIGSWDVSPLTCTQDTDCVTTLNTNYGGGITNWALTLTPPVYASGGIATSTCASAPPVNTDFTVTIHPTIAPGSYYTVYAGWNTGSCTGAPYLRAIDDTRNYTVTAGASAAPAPTGYIPRAYIID